MPRTKKAAVEPIAEAVSETPATEAAVAAAEEVKEAVRKKERQLGYGCREKGRGAGEDSCKEGSRAGQH